MRAVPQFLFQFPVRGGAWMQCASLLRNDGVLNPPPTSNRWNAEQEHGTDCLQNSTIIAGYGPDALTAFLAGFGGGAKPARASSALYRGSSRSGSSMGSILSHETYHDR